jgi:hypothetical protein
VTIRIDETLSKPNTLEEKVRPIISQAFSEKKPTIIEAYVDPFEPPMPPKVDMTFISNMAESLLLLQGNTSFKQASHFGSLILIRSNICSWLACNVANTFRIIFFPYWPCSWRAYMVLL